MIYEFIQTYKEINSISRPGPHDHEAWKVIAAQAHVIYHPHSQTAQQQSQQIPFDLCEGDSLAYLCVRWPLHQPAWLPECTLSLEDWPCGFSTLPPAVNPMPAMASELYILSSPEHCHQPTLSTPPPRWWLATLSLRSPCSLQDRPGPTGVFLPLVLDPDVWTQCRMCERVCGRPKAGTPSSLCPTWGHPGVWRTFLSTCIFPSPKAKPVSLPATCPGNSAVSRTLSAPSFPQLLPSEADPTLHYVGAMSSVGLLRLVLILLKEKWRHIWLNVHSGSQACWWDLLVDWM